MYFKVSWLIVKVAEYSLISCGSLTLTGVLIKDSNLTLQLTTPENTITYHNALCLSTQNFA